jgi:hypothetical protein
MLFFFGRYCRQTVRVLVRSSLPRVVRVREVVFHLAQLLALVVRVEPLLLLDHGLRQGLDPSREGPELQDRGGGRRPGLEGHPDRELEDRLGVESVGLRALERGAGERGDGAGVRDHDLDALGTVKRQRQVEAVGPVDSRTTCAQAPRFFASWISLWCPSAPFASTIGASLRPEASIAATSSLALMSTPTRLHLSKPRPPFVVR